jgi:hypothetical protein
LEKEKNLDILAQQRYENGYRWQWPELPTWTSDWRNLRLNDFNIAERRAMSTKSLPPLVSPHSPKFRREGNALILRGFIIDTFGPSTEGFESCDDNWLRRIPDDKKANRLLFGEESPTIETIERLQSRTKEKDSRISHLWREGESLSEEETMRWHIGMRTDRGLLAVTFPYFEHDPPAKICCFFGGRSLFVLQEKEIDPRNGKMLHTLVAGHCFIDGFENGKGIDMARRLGLKEEEIYLA